MTAHAYLRKSSTYGSTDPDAKAQEKAVREFAARFGDSSLLVFSDMDISGTGRYTGKRLGYQELVSAVQTGRASAVYSYSLSRLARSVAEIARFLDLCASQKVPVRLVVDSVDTSTASGRMTANVLASVAQFEAEVAGERVKARIALKRANGEPVGAPPYGDKLGEDLQAVLTAFNECGSFRGAARMLNERGIPTRHGGPWGASSVSAVVRKRDRLLPTPGRGVRVRGSFRLSRLLICGTCEAPLTGTHQTDKRKKPHVIRTIYECHRGHAMPHPKRSIHEPAILPAVIAEAMKYQPPTQEEIVGDAARREALDAEAGRLSWQHQKGLLPDAEFARRMADIRDRLDRLEIAYRITWHVPGLSAEDFNRYSPAHMNRILRALWRAVRLDPMSYQPLSFEPHPDPFAAYAAAQADAEHEWVEKLANAV